MMQAAVVARDLIAAWLLGAQYMGDAAADDPRLRSLRRTRMVLQGSHPLVREFNSQLPGETLSTH